MIRARQPSQRSQSTLAPHPRAAYREAGRKRRSDSLDVAEGSDRLAFERRSKRGPPEPPRLAVLVADPDALARGWIRLALRGTEFHVAAEAATAAEAAELVVRRRLDVLLAEHRLPDRVGTELVRDLRRKGISLPTVLMAATPERGLNETAREAAAQGAVLKTGSVADLLRSLRGALSGQHVFDHPARSLGCAALSPREREVLQLIAYGSTNREIAATLGLGIETVKTLVARAFVKLGARRRAQAVSTGYTLGIL